MNAGLTRVLAWLVLLAPTLAHALVVAPVSVSSSAQAVLPNQGAQGSLTWSMEVRPPAGAGPGGVVVRSTQLVYRSTTGTVLAVQSRPLSRSVTSIAVVSLSETFQLPAGVAYQALRLGSMGVVIERSFSDTGDPGVVVTGSLTLPLATTPGGGLQVSRIDLLFANQSRTAMVPRDSEHQAVARLSTEGNGWLDAQWQIADGSGQQGEPLYRPLRAFRQFVGGGQVIELRSPPLPTQRSGRFLVRLAVREPAGAAQAAPLLYQVLDTTRLPDLALLQPADGVLLAPDTRFAWDTVPGAKAYLLELMPDHNEPLGNDPNTSDPAAARSGAALVPADSTELRLSALVQNGLQAGQRYRWRVLAIDERGRTLAQSVPRRIQLP